MDSEFSSGAHGPSQPPTSAHKVIGTLNMIFAGLLLMYGACIGIYFVVQAAMTPMLENMQQSGVQESMNAQANQQREKQIAELKEQAETATSDEQRQQIESEIDELQQQEPVEMPKIDMMALNRDPHIVGFLWTDLGTAAVLNVLLFVSGVGLLGPPKAWGAASWLSGPPRLKSSG